MKNGVQKSLNRKREIYLVAARMFVEKGFDSTSLTDIAAALNITKPALYYYFESKQELLFQIANLGLNLVKDEILTPGREIGDAEERLRFIILNHTRLAAEGNYAVIIVSHEMNSLTFKQREHILNLRRIYFEFVRETLTALKASGKMREIDTATATLTLFGMIVWLSRWFRPHGKRPVGTVCRDVCEMAMNGLLKNPAV